MSSDTSKQAPVTPRARPYKDFLNADFHRRFVQAFLITGGVCYIDAVCMGQWDPFWIWFPLGPAGLRALLLLLASLFVYIIRVAYSHIGERISASPTQAVRHIFGLHTLVIFILYLASAFFFLETYIAFGGAPNMGRFETERPHERERINERPVYLRTIVYLFLVPSQTISHLFFDQDKVVFPREAENTTTAGPASMLPDMQTFTKAVKIMNTTFWHALAVSFFGTLIYHFTSLRYTTWRIAYTFWSLLVPRANGPGRYPPDGLLDMSVRCLFEAFLLLFLWNNVNNTFNFFLSKEPLKKGQPLTNDSKDPNMSLVQGLRSKKELPRSFAYWELALITRRFDARRLSIYEDYSKSAWKKILDACISEISEITRRIEATKPAPPAAPAPAQPIESLPRIAQPLKQDPVLNPNAPPFSRVGALGSFAKQHGSTPGGTNFSPKAMRLIESGRDRILPPQAQAELQQKGFSGVIANLLLPLIHAPTIGPYLRLTFARQATMIIAGSPYSRLSTIISAVGAVSSLAEHSLKEDRFGQVAPTVPVIVRTLIAAITSIDSFIATATPHWSDIDFKEEDRKVPEVELIRTKLGRSLYRVVMAHNEYLEGEGLSSSEARQAHAMADMFSPKPLPSPEEPPQMEEVKG